MNTIQCSSLHIKLITLFVVATFMITCISYGGENLYKYISVKKKLDRSLSEYGLIFVNVNATDDGNSRDNISRSVYLKSDIRDNLKEQGIKQTVKNEGSQLTLECRFNYQIGLPRLVRNYHIIYEYLTFVNIKVVDTGSKSVLGEVEYRGDRRAVKTRHLISAMLNSLQE